MLKNSDQDRFLCANPVMVQELALGGTFPFCAVPEAEEPSRKKRGVVPFLNECSKETL